MYHRKGDNFSEQFSFIKVEIYFEKRCTIKVKEYFKAIHDIYLGLI